jgi:hypothetical protein
MPPPIDALNEARAYKPFIDGLRAIAILTVAGSHVDFPGLSGGYVGVDNFFVISGYLIIDQDIAMTMQSAQCQEEHCSENRRWQTTLKTKYYPSRTDG